MNRSRSGPRAVMVAAGIVAILAAACGGSTATTAPSAAATAAPAATEPALHRGAVDRRHHP